MKRFKKIINLTLCFALMLLLIPKQVSAIDIIDNTISIINDDIVEGLLDNSGYGGNSFETYILYNNENVPSYTLGVSEIGYIIVENETLAIHEYGEGNPYVDADGTLFYAGPLNYFNVENNTITNLTTLEIENELPVSLSITPTINDGDVSTYSVVESGVTKVSNYKNYIQRRAFGLNDNNICGAVAVQIALNYLELQTGRDFVHTSHESEILTTTAYNSSKYPKAKAMLSHLANVCGMSSNLFGTHISSAFSTYVDITNITDKSISLSSSGIPNVTSVKNSINNNKPVVYSTLPSTPTYASHYLVAYGYKIDSSTGDTMLLSHSGWYSRILEDNGIYRHQDIYLNYNYVVYVHYFNY